MTTPLPTIPSLEQLKNQAKDLVKQFKSSQPDAIARVQAHLPPASHQPPVTNNQEPGTNYQPPATSHQEPATSYQLPATTSLTLSQSQLVIAREHGFPSWPRLKRHIEETQPDSAANLDAFKKAVLACDSRKVRSLLRAHKSLRDRINAPIVYFDSPAIVYAASHGDRKLVDALLEFGANIDARSTWWAGGFGVLPHSDPEFAEFLVQRGAAVDVWAAAGLNRLDRLRELIAADPTCVNARGGDGQGPLQFAASIEAAKILLDAGADIDMRDIDHESTAAQRMCVDRPEVCRYLLSRGAKLDIFMAVQLGDLALVKQALAADPECRTAHVGAGEFATKESEGGHIYIYILKDGGNPVLLAAALGHKDIYNYLLDLGTPLEQFLAACYSADEPAARKVLAQAPDMVKSLEPGQMRLIADAAWKHRTDAVRLMLKLGFDVDARGDHESTPLNRAAVRGFADLIDLLIDAGASLEARNEFGGKPLSACLWGADNFRDPDGDYLRSVERFIQAGAPLTDMRVTVENRQIAAAIRRHLEPLSRTNIIAAIKIGSLPRVRALIEANSELINAKTSGALPLYESTRSNQPEIAAFLLERGADRGQTESDGGGTALDLAVTSDRPAIAAMLR